MYIVSEEKNEYNQYACIQTWENKEIPNGFLEFPEDKWGVFFPSDKKGCGFVDFRIDGKKIIDVIWNEEAYQAYLASLPEPEEPNPPATLEDRLTAVEAETAALTAAIERGLAL